MALLEAENQKLLGDQAYKASCFTQAIEHYTTAISLGGDRQSILSNRSASSFESGDYARCLEDAARAFELDATSNLATKVALRATRACFWSADFQSARSWLKKVRLAQSNDALELLQAHLDSAEKPWPAHESSTSTCSEIPMYRPTVESKCGAPPLFCGCDIRSLLSGASSTASYPHVWVCQQFEIALQSVLTLCDVQRLL